MRVYGGELNVLIREEVGTLQVLCSQEVLKKIIDAHDIQEPIWMDEGPHLITSMDFTDLEQARLGYDLFVLNLTLRKITHST